MLCARRSVRPAWPALAGTTRIRPGPGLRHTAPHARTRLPLRRPCQVPRRSRGGVVGFCGILESAAPTGARLVSCRDQQQRRRVRADAVEAEQARGPDGDQRDDQLVQPGDLGTGELHAPPELAQSDTEGVGGGVTGPGPQGCDRLGQRCGALAGEPCPQLVRAGHGRLPPGRTGRGIPGRDPFTASGGTGPRRTTRAQPQPTCIRAALANQALE